MRLARVRCCLVVAATCAVSLSACAPAVETKTQEAPIPAEVAPVEESSQSSQLPPEAPPSEQEQVGGAEDSVPPAPAPAPVAPPAEEPVEPPPPIAPPEDETPEPEPPSVRESVFQPEGTIAPDDEAIRRAEAGASTDAFWFETAETIDGLSFGLVGDGKTDNTEIFRKLLAGGNRTIHIPAGDYVTNALQFESNTALILAPGVTIRDAGRLGSSERFFNIRGIKKVRIRGFGARVIAKREDYTTGEQRHGILIFGARRVLIEGLESSGHGGDGFYIGGPLGDPSTDVMLTGCKAGNNRRQGLSITSARRVNIVDCEFTDTNGTDPQFGIDLEPNYTTDVLDEITLLRTYTQNNAGGDIMINLHAQDSTSERVDVSIIEHSTPTETPNLYIYVAPGADTILRYSKAPGR